ncbi:MAG TPA: TIGR04086 family membrane protein [Tissierellales bacterium]|nr:TIGR04086 family membrane protein [Tissierellales bacterium]
MKSKTINFLWSLLKSLVLSYIVTLGLVLIMAIMLTYTPLKEKSIPLLNTITMMISIITGAIYLTLKIGEKGWLNGGIVGVVYYLILLLINIIFIKNHSIDIYTTSKIIISLVTGVIGGMIGINLK